MPVDCQQPAYACIACGKPCLRSSVVASRAARRPLSPIAGCRKIPTNWYTTRDTQFQVHSFSSLDRWILGRCKTCSEATSKFTHKVDIQSELESRSPDSRLTNSIDVLYTTRYYVIIPLTAGNIGVRSHLLLFQAWILHMVLMDLMEASPTCHLGWTRKRLTMEL